MRLYNDFMDEVKDYLDCSNNAPLSEQIKCQHQKMEDDILDAIRDIMQEPFSAYCEAIKDTEIALKLTIKPLHTLKKISITFPDWWKFYYSIWKYAGKFENTKAINNFRNKSRYILFLENEHDKEHIGCGKYYRMIGDM